MGRAPAAERFAAHVDVDGPDPGDPSLPGRCALWTGCRTRFGVGRFRVDHRRELRAHVFAWQRAHGPIPAGQHLINRCGVPACVNVDHYALGDTTDRALARRGGHRLTPQAVWAIRAGYASGGLNQYELAALYGCRQSTVSLIVNRKIWVDLVEPVAVIPLPTHPRSAGAALARPLVYPPVR